jgi:hypothetical protein
MEMPLRYLPLYTAFALVTLSGVVNGFWTDRWSTSQAATDAAARLRQVPLTAGEWQGEDLPDEQTQAEPIAGTLYRRYVNRATGAVVSVALVCGLPGPVSIHTPDVCYRAGGFEVAAPLPFKLEGGPGPTKFLTADLHKKKAAEEIHQRIFWSWCAAGNWKVPGNPRREFARQSVLFKLYLVRQLSSKNEPLGQDDPCADLLRQLLPQLRRTLFTPN